jgi:hypothetical protein
MRCSSTSRTIVCSTIRVRTPGHEIRCLGADLHADLERYALRMRMSVAL